MAESGGVLDAIEIEQRVRDEISQLVTTHPMGESLAEMAYHLARLLDAGSLTALAVAGVSKELRETLVELAAMKAGDSDDLATALSHPTSLRDPAGP